MKIKDLTTFLGITKLEAKPKIDTQTPKVLKTPEEPKKVILAWEALSRPTKNKVDERRMKNFIVIGIVVSLLLIVMQEIFLILGVVGIIFVNYLITKVPVESMKYEISNKGIDYGGQLFLWEELTTFYFTQNNNLTAVAITTKDRLPGRLYLTIKPTEQEHLKKVLEEYLYFLEEEPKTFIDKAFESLLSNIEIKSVRK